MLGTQLLTQMLGAMLAAYLLAQTRIGSYAGRAGFVTLAGILARLSFVMRRPTLPPPPPHDEASHA